MSPMPINHPVLVFARRAGDFLFSPVGLAGIVLLAIVVFGCAYTVDQTEQVVITQFGRPVGSPINAVDSASGAGLHFKIPVDVGRFEWEAKHQSFHQTLQESHPVQGFGLYLNGQLQSDHAVQSHFEFHSQ